VSAHAFTAPLIRPFMAAFYIFSATLTNGLGEFSFISKTLP
jgi:hypothetical protein